jgi:hypothetical protein
MRFFQIKFFIALLFVGVFCIAKPVSAQKLTGDLPTQNGWRDFKLNSTNAEDVLKALGKAKKDKTETFNSSVPSDWSPAKKGQLVRTLSYKNIGDYDSLEFYFIENQFVGLNLLVDQNKQKGLLHNKSTILEAVKIPQIFQTNFLIVQKIPATSKISDYEGQKEPNIPKVYPQIYTMLGISQNSIILVNIDNTNFKSGWRTITGKPTIEFLPGFAQRIQLISRGDKK